LQRREVAGRAAGNDENLVNGGIRAFLLQGLAESVTVPPVNDDEPTWSAQVFEASVFLTGDDRCGHTVDDAAGDDEVEATIARFHERLRSARAKMDRSCRESLHYHRHAAEYHHFDVQPLLFEKAFFPTHPQWAVAERFA
jgi:hypothetical protein